MKTKFLTPLIAGLGLLCACKGRGSSSLADSASIATNTSDYSLRKSAQKNDTAENIAKLVKTADIHFKVKDVKQTGERIATLTAACGGMVVHHVMGSTSDNSLDIKISNDSTLRVTSYNTTAEMTLKIPPAKMEEFINQVARMGIYINNLRMDINDKTLDFVSTKLKIKNRNELMDREKKEKSTDEVLNLKDHMADQLISNRAIDDSVKNSTITLSFYQSNVVNREIIANDNLSAYNQSLSKRLGMAIENGWEVFEDIFVALANFWILLPISIAVWLIIRYNKGKKVVKLVKSPQNL